MRPSKSDPDRHEAPKAQLHLPLSWRSPLVQSVFAALNGQARFVGGCVRDAALGVAAMDIDLATPIRPQEAMDLLAGAGIAVAPTGLPFGTITAHGGAEQSGGKAIEITTLRRDIATDGRHAVVAFTQDWRQDAARRDFTFNAMSADWQGRLYDYFDGRADLAAGRVRFIGSARDRLAEDRLRALRFFRFFARFGSGAADAGVLAAITDMAATLDRLSAERIWGETKRLLAVRAPLAGCRLMRQTGADWGAFGVAVDPDALAALLDLDAPVAGGGIEVLVRFAAAMGPATAWGLAGRLKLSRKEASFLRSLAAPGAAELLEEVHRDGKEIAAARARLAGNAARAREACGLNLAAFPLTGADLLAAGIPAGPGLGTILRGIEDWWLDHKTRPDRTECLAEMARRQAL